MTPKKEGRFTTQLDVSEIDIGVMDKSGLVKQMIFGVEWWSLMKEPVYKYLFRWKRGSSVYSPKEMFWIDATKLSKYPDLLKRYQQLKPTFIEVELLFIFEFGDEYTNQNQAFSQTLPSCIRASSYAQIAGKTFYFPKTTGTVDINSNTNFYIAKAGKTGNELVPGSCDWKQFLKFNNASSAWDPCSVENTTIYKIFKQATKVSLSAQLKRIKVPEKEIDALAKAYKEKEKKEADEDEALEKEIDQDDENSRKEIDKDKANDWDSPSNNDKSNAWDTSNSTKNEGANDWDNPINKDNTNDWDVSKSTNKDADDWDSSDNKANSNDWDAPNQALSDKESHEIKHDGDRQGVYDKVTNAMVIPFGDYRILEYKAASKIAMVQKNIHQRSETVSCVKDGTVDINTFHKGYIGHIGNWVIEPEKHVTVYGKYSSIAWYGLVLVAYDETSEQYERRIGKEKKVKDDKKCYAAVKARANNIAADYKSQGLNVKVSTDFYRRH